jgi:hypothetical protein
MKSGMAEVFSALLQRGARPFELGDVMIELRDVTFSLFRSLGLRLSTCVLGALGLSG